MLFRPNFCANCGEKIERADWGILTSRRFCQVCESEYKGQDVIPRVIVGFGVLLGVLGFGSYLRSGNVAQTPLAMRQPAKTAEQRPAETPSVQPAAKTETVQTANLPQTPNGRSASKQEPKPTTVEESLYFCGAETKKGTPCTRRVKGNTRCYQHKGMPAMLPAEKLRAG